MLFRSRFQFEKAFYERRQDGPLNPQDFKKLMTESWAGWYGDSLSEMDPMTAKRIAGPGARGTLACVGVSQAAAGLVADGLGAATSAAMALLLEDGGASSPGSIATLAALGTGATLVGMLGAGMLQDRVGNERGCLPLRATFLVASLALGASVTAEELVAHCKELLAGYKVPREIRFVAQQ